MTLIENTVAGRASTLVRVSMALIATVVASGCETSDRDASSVSLLELQDASADWPAITRAAKDTPYLQSEDWDWPGGALHVVRLRRNRYYQEDFLDPEDMIEAVGNWRSGSDARLNSSDISADKNSIGRFQYTVVESGPRNCFYMIQPFAHHAGPDYERQPGSENSSGFVTLVHCASKSVMSAEKLEQRGLTFAASLKSAW